MQKHLTAIWKLTLCTSLYAHLLGCNASRVRMGIGQQRSVDKPTVNHQVPGDAISPIFDKFNDITPTSFTPAQLQDFILQMIKNIQKLVKDHPAFTSTTISIPGELVADMDNLPDETYTIYFKILNEYAKDYIILKRVMAFIGQYSATLHTIKDAKNRHTLLKDQPNPIIVQTFTSLCKRYNDASKALQDNVQCPNCKSYAYRRHTGYTNSCHTCNNTWNSYKRTPTHNELSLCITSKQQKMNTY